jgi:hypothetical protein
MRQFFARPSGVSFEATGCVSPNPLANRVLGLTPCERKYATTSSARREDRVDVVSNAFALQRGADRQIIGIAGDDDFGVLQVLQFADVLVERLPTVGAELIAALGEQHVAGDDPFLLLLHRLDLGLLCRRLGACLQLRVCWS